MAHRDDRSDESNTPQQPDNTGREEGVERPQPPTQTGQEPDYTQFPGLDPNVFTGWRYVGHGQWEKL